MISKFLLIFCFLLTANEVSGNGMLEGWWHRDALSRNRTSAFGMQIVPDDDSVTGLIPSHEAANRRSRAARFETKKPARSFLRNGPHNGGLASPVFIQTLQPKVHPLHELSPANHTRIPGVFQPYGASNRIRSATRPAMSQSA